MRCIYCGEPVVQIVRGFVPGPVRPDDVHVDSKFTSQQPKWYCKACQRQFGYPTLIKIGDGLTDYKPLIQKISFYIGGHWGGNESLIMTPERVDYEMKPSPGDFWYGISSKELKWESNGLPKKEKSIWGRQQWFELLKQLFENQYIQDWFPEYRPDGIVFEGEQWRLIIDFQDGTEMTFDGDNTYPEQWQWFIRTVKPLMRESDE